MPRVESTSSEQNASVWWVTWFGRLVCIVAITATGTNANNTLSSVGSTLTTTVSYTSGTDP